MKTITLEIENEADAILLLELAHRLNLKTVKKVPIKDEQDFIQLLLEKPLQITDFTPLKRDEIYE
jgi:hypothetical protein